MKALKLKNLPIGILLIASFYVFGAFVLIINIFTNPVGVRETVARAHGLLAIIGGNLYWLLRRWRLFSPTG